MVAECERVAPAETGGVLMGYRTEGDGDPVATHVIGPGPRAVHRECRFVPDHEYQLAEMSRLYKLSGRRLDYLGDWHSHPGGGGGLSEQDRATLGRIARTRSARVERPVMLVMAGQASWEAVAWVHESPTSWTRRRRQIIRSLDVELFDPGDMLLD